MAIFSPFLTLYVGLFTPLISEGASYHARPPFPEAFLDLRRFLAYSGVPIYWISIALFFARYFDYPPYLVRSPGTPPAEQPPSAAPGAPLNDYGLPVREGFRALIPYHLGLDLVSLSSEDHYVRVVTDRGNSLIRYRFADALAEVRNVPGLQVHRSHWVAIRAVDRVQANGKSYSLMLCNGTIIPVSRTNIGVLRSAGLI
jgi:hypothetical protein